MTMRPSRTGGMVSWAVGEAQFAKRIRKAGCGELPGSPERSANAGTVGGDEPAAVSQVSPWVEGAEEVRFVAQPFGILTLPSK